MPNLIATRRQIGMSAADTASASSAESERRSIERRLILQALRGALESDEYRLKIILNGDPLDLPAAVTISELLADLQIDPRRVAVEHNLIVLKRGTFDTTMVAEGDQVEIVNFVGGGAV